MIPGIAFRNAIVTADGSYIVVVTIDKSNKDCISVFNATNGNHLHKVALRGCNIKVCFLGALDHSRSFQYIFEHCSSHFQIKHSRK